MSPAEAKEALAAIMVIQGQISVLVALAQNEHVRREVLIELIEKEWMHAEEFRRHALNDLLQGRANA